MSKVELLKEPESFKECVHQSLSAGLAMGAGMLVYILMRGRGLTHALEIGLLYFAAIVFFWFTLGYTMLELNKSGYSKLTKKVIVSIVAIIAFVIMFVSIIKLFLLSVQK